MPKISLNVPVILSGKCKTFTLVQNVKYVGKYEIWEFEMDR